jgi:hypothetical protein
MATTLRMIGIYLGIFAIIYIGFCFSSAQIITPTDILYAFMMMSDDSRACIFILFLGSMLGVWAQASIMGMPPEERAALDAAVNREMAEEYRADAIRSRSTSMTDIALGVAGGVVLGNVISDIID